LTRVKEEAFQKAEEAEEGKRILDALLEHIPEGITITGGPPDYLIKFVSRKGQDLTGKSKDEIVGMPAGDHVNAWGLYSPDGVTQPTPEQSTLYRAARFGETVIDEEWVLKRPDGRSIPILCNVAPIRSETGEIIGGIKAFRDITDRKRAEEALRKSEEKYRTLFEQSVEGIYLHDLEGNILDVNRIAVLQSGYSKEELLRMNVLDLLPGKIESEDILRQWKEWPAEQRFTFKIKHGRKNGTVFPVEVTTGKVSFVDKVLLLAIVQDITDRKRAEEELRRAHDELELRVEVRTSELKSSNRALGEYAAKLERLNQELQEFAFVASHDLQEPLRKIQMFSDLLKNPRGSLSEEQRRDYFERMQSAAERMRAMINALLEYSRVTTKGQSFTEVSLSESAKKALQVLDLKIEETGARVHIAELPEVEADPFQMVQLFQNLIENALKFHKKDIPPEVTIHSEPIAKDQIRIIVEDNGIGFNEKNLSRLFIPFERLQGAEFSGTGIGLAICRKLVERHGGTITAKSSPGKGSAFIIDLPVKQKHVENANRPPHEAT
jgi:two-component system, LuxR family, sensor kinase FixL